MPGWRIRCTFAAHLQKYIHSCSVEEWRKNDDKIFQIAFALAESPEIAARTGCPLGDECSSSAPKLDYRKKPWLSLIQFHTVVVHSEPFGGMVNLHIFWWEEYQFSLSSHRLRPSEKKPKPKPNKISIILSISIISILCILIFSQ